MRVTSFLYLAGFAACSPLTSRGRQSTKEFLAPLHGKDHKEAIRNEYIVVFNPGHTLEQHYETIGRNLSNSARFDRSSFGYRANLDDDTRDNLVRRDPGVHFVETNQVIHLVEPVNSTDIDEATPDAQLPHAKRMYAEVHSSGSPYGLQMITTGSEKLPTPVQDKGVYDYLHSAGEGVQVYVLDTGIRTTHSLFGGRARNFGDLASTDTSPYCREQMDDTHGHGTHVAGTVGAKKYGVAPSASLINVKVIGPGGDSYMISKAIGDITNEHKANKAKTGQPFWAFRGSVINMSLSFPDASLPVVMAINAANEAGISVFAAAGNANIDAGSTYPCAYPATRCIAAVDNTYDKASFSNYGSVVNYIAPGDNVLSLGISSDTSLSRKSGTSMASPHAAGTAAVFAYWKGVVSNYDLSENFIYWNSISGVVSGFTGTTDLFVTTGIHSPKKYPNEPFRWAGDWPVKNHAINGTTPSGTIDPTVQTASSSLPLSDYVTSGFAVMATSSFAALTGLTTELGSSTWDPVLSGSASATGSGSVAPSSATPSSAAPSSAAPSSAASVAPSSIASVAPSSVASVAPSSAASVAPSSAASFAPSSSSVIASSSAFF